jgi:hypothetical protein
MTRVAINGQFRHVTPNYLITGVAGSLRQNAKRHGTNSPSFQMKFGSRVLSVYFKKKSIDEKEKS